VPRAGRWLWEARRSGSDGSNDVQDLSTVGHVVVVGSPYHNAKPSTFNTNGHALAMEILWDYVSTNPGRVDPLATCQLSLQENEYVHEAPPRDETTKLIEHPSLHGQSPNNWKIFRIV